MKKLEKISAAVATSALKKGGSTAAKKTQASAKAAKPSNRTNKALVKQVAFGKGNDGDEDMGQD